MSMSVIRSRSISYLVQSASDEGRPLSSSVLDMPRLLPRLSPTMLGNVTYLS